MEDNNFRNKLIVLALVRFSGINSRAFDWLLKRFSSPEGIMKAEARELTSGGVITDEVSDRISAANEKLKSAEDFYKELKARDIKIVTRLDKDYPERLFELNDPPALFYLRGALPKNEKKSVAIVGASKATSEGIALTGRLAAAFSKAGVQVISSFAQGIDYAAHLGSKSGDSASFAVLEKGFDHIDSKAEMPVAIDLVRSGGVISEYPPGAELNKQNYKESNRIIAGLSQAVVITEIYESSSRIHDILEFCHQIGKLVFLSVDSENGALSDEKSLAKITERGAIPMIGLEKVDDMIKSLV